MDPHSDFCLPFLVLVALHSLPLTKSITTNLLDIVGSNLLVTQPVLSTCSFSLVSSFISSTVAFSCACSSSSWDSQRLSRRVFTGRVDIQSIYSSDSPCDFRLLSLFLLRVRYLSFRFLFCLCSRLSSSSLSVSLPTEWRLRSRLASTECIRIHCSLS
jgi:hypothetical protein